MCARYTLTRTDLGAVAAELGAALDPSAPPLALPRYNVAPSQTCLVARHGGAAPVLTPAVWGLRLGGRVVVNLRSETAGRYRELRRVVVPADGFYEWTGDKRPRRPIWYHRPGGELMFLAGLLDPAAGTPPPFAVLTARAEAPMRDVHDRMPVLFGPERARAWLVRGGLPVSEAMEIRATEVSTRVNLVANDEASLIDAVAPARSIG
jgi:putative SOS response-associated peptidase YedK